jgi:antitoxin component of RelBE/YafQ-DinJ toxin-antitoxin module
MKKLTRRFDARFDDQTIRKLSALAKQTGLTRSEIVRLLVAKAFSKDLKTPS